MGRKMRKASSSSLVFEFRLVHRLDSLNHHDPDTEGRKRTKGIEFSKIQKAAVNGLFCKPNTNIPDANAHIACNKEEEENCK